MSLPIRYDEGYTYINFIDKNFSFLFYYPLPNNHVLFTLFSKTSTFLFGPHPLSLRLPAILFGLLSIIFLQYISKEISGKEAGFFSSLCIAITPYIVFYSILARGYSLINLFSILVCLFAYRYTKSLDRITVFFISFTSSLGMFTIPTMIYPLSGIYLWVILILFIKSKSIRTIIQSFFVPLALMNIIFTTLLYTPVYIASGGSETILNNSAVQSLTWSHFWSRLPPSIITSAKELFRDIPIAISFSLVTFFLLGQIKAYKQKNWPLFWLFPSVSFGFLLLLLVRQNIPHTRIWQYLFIFFFITCDYGFLYATQILNIKRLNIVYFSLCLFSIYFTINMVVKNPFNKYPDIGNFPEAPILSQYLKEQNYNIGEIKFRNPVNFTMLYYLDLFQVSFGDKNKKTTDKTTVNCYIVQKDRYSIEDLTTKSVEKIFEFGRGEIYVEKIY